MPFALPSLPDLVQRARAAMRAEIPGTDAWLWPNNLYVIAKVFGEVTYELIGFADDIRKQIFVTTADSESLDRHGAEYGLARRPAAPASGVLTLASTGDLFVDLNAVFQRADGVQYRATMAVARTGAGDLAVTVLAAVDGAAGNAAAGVSLAVVSGVTGAATAIVSDGIVGGVDVEDDESWRARILFRKRNPPHAGSAADYVRWCGEVSGVSRVYVEPKWAGVGTVRVFPLMDDLYANGIAPSPALARVRDYIEAVRPVGADVTVAAPAAVVVPITVTGISPNTVAVREAVKSELRDAFRRLSRVAGNATAFPGMPYLASPTKFSRSWIWQAVANASGEESHTITAPAADIDLAAGQMAVLGDITFEG